ncbi:hypothetical protein M378DRAFT_190807 [Amanita muscaria Koide BX008]|uniref:Translation initiation factor eIF2B subunit gamma n=1 Tax=Amanita muscaria (strain Koide BX008) TaxID=946122 RepID=A0A0C2XHQ5_AMAMK|nr:hypothetical protein M378DRAFT_190807 [Amanita muscaria Koide BX008]
MDLDGVKHELESEFIAIILAGFGNDLRPLTSDYGDEACPKALLPLANRPLLEYVLSWLEQSGIKDVLLICPETHRSTLHHHINSEVSSSLRVDLQSLPEPQDAGVGTCTLLRHFSDRVKKDFVLLPCDFIPPPSFSLQMLLDRFRTDIVSDGAAVITCWYPGPNSEHNQPLDEWGPSPYSSILCDALEETLLYIDASEDPEFNGEDFFFRTAMLTKHPRTKLLGGYQDSHIYVCQRAILDTLCAKPRCLSFREEFLPWLCKMNYQSNKKQKYGYVLQPSLNAPQNLALEHSTHHAGAHMLPSPAYATRPQRQPNYSATQIPSNRSANEKSLSLRIGIVLLSAGAFRVNSISSLFEVNRRILLNVAYTLPLDPKDRSLIDSKAQISVDSIVGSSTQVSERAMIKKSTIGRHCKIGKQARITNCILFDHCIVEEGARLDSCILGKNSKIGAMSEITRCITQAGYEVTSRESIKGEKLEVSDWMAPSNFPELE